MIQSVLRRLVSQEAVLPSLAVLAGIIAIVAWLSPADKVLGDLVKLVYVHGAIIQVSLLTFVSAGLLGAAYLLADRVELYEWSQALERAGLVLWVLYVLTSAASMILAWGGIAWFEPRWIFAIQILIIAPLVHFGGMLLQSRRVSAFLNAAMAGIILFLLSQARLVMHPLSPVSSSPTAGIKLAYYLLLVLWAVAAVQLARALWDLARRRELPA